MDAGKPGGVMWRYDEYSEWSRSLARSHGVDDLKRLLTKLTKESERLKSSHLRAVQATTSMGSQSQRRAQTRSSLVLNYSHRMAVEDAIAIATQYPEHARARLQAVAEKPANR